MNNKKVLVISYDPDIPGAISDIFRGHNIDIVLGSSLSDGSNLLQKENPGLIIIECPVNLTAGIANLLSSVDSGKKQVILISREKRFLEDFNGKNIYKFSFDEINTRLKSKIIELVG